jgi:hypothetical protein
MSLDFLRLLKYFSSKLWGSRKHSSLKTCPTVGGCKRARHCLLYMPSLSGILSGPQIESFWTRPRWSGLTSWHSSQPLLCVRCEMCAVNHLTTSQCALIGSRCVPCPCKITVRLDKPKGTDMVKALGIDNASWRACLVVVHLQLALGSGSYLY